MSFTPSLKGGCNYYTFAKYNSKKILINNYNLTTKSRKCNYYTYPIITSVKVSSASSPLTEYI